jgi:hypothetical protein
MKRFQGFNKRRSGKPIPLLGGVAAFPAILLAVCFGLARTASGQAAPSVNTVRLTLSAGATASGYYLQYGEQKMLGISGFIDADTRRHLGVEGEARWLVFRQTYNVHATTYSIGPRYYMTFGRFQPYVKGLVGLGEFNFPYNDARGSYLVATSGGGVDYRLNRRIRLRLADFEYQYWPEFTYNAMTSYGISSGIRVSVY